ncbi:MAG TPA: DNA polymerase ligase N-terminal domain-containing protein [Methylomirabilota bacterium]|jgi:bifunctional non-homologous end joining protein LigD|nr:DNA polymerase ligase N-terminal domain-containing protein [Methylomirabilota bacterium]
MTKPRARKRPGETPKSAAAAKRRTSTRRARPAAALPDLSRYGQLAEYNRKRHFGVTPEPPGKPVTRTTPRPLEFVVQKHRASQLHYDFRLEHRGVMPSWAIPKGPSLDPAVKRLAMQTEPHPMDYNQFEGVIPEGEYGGGTVMIWDKGVWAPVATDRLGDETEADRQLKKGELKFVLLGQKLAGSWVLVRTRGTRQWLLIKHRDQYASAEDITVTKPLSVVSGRTMAEIGRTAGASPRQLQQAAAADPVSVGAAGEAETRRREAAGARSRRSGNRGAVR